METAYITKVKKVFKTGLWIIGIIILFIGFYNLAKGDGFQSKIDNYNLSLKQKREWINRNCLDARIVIIEALQRSAEGIQKMSLDQTICYQNKLQVLNCTDRFETEMDCSKDFTQPSK